jgi:hypothetical protein
MRVWNSEVYKECRRCKVVLPLVDGCWQTPRSFNCINCRGLAIKEAKSRFRKKNIRACNEEVKEWRRKNRDKVLFQKAKYRQLNPSAIKAQRKKYLSNPLNKAKKKQQDRNYYLRNKKSIQARQKKWAKTKIEYMVRLRVSHLIRSHLKKSGSSKGASSFSKLGYTPHDLRLHLENQFEPWMSWDNYGHYRVADWDDNNKSTWKWQIDHITPQSKTPYDSMDHPNFKMCWALSNLRPLSAKENVLKGNRI